jgi:predicted AAA+ superfamily ATPase
MLSAREYPIVTILVIRQSGKTTLARMTFPDKESYLLENPDMRMAAEADPREFLGQMKDSAILDEV